MQDKIRLMPWISEQMLEGFLSTTAGNDLQVIRSDANTLDEALRDESVDVLLLDDASSASLGGVSPLLYRNPAMVIFEVTNHGRRTVVKTLRAEETILGQTDPNSLASEMIRFARAQRAVVNGT